MQYVVKAVGDDELPEGMHSLVVEQVDGPPLLLINGEPARCWSLMQGLQAMFEPCTQPTMLFPERPLLHAV